jgi:hypothetical protein
LEPLRGVPLAKDLGVRLDGVSSTIPKSSKSLEEEPGEVK